MKRLIAAVVGAAVLAFGAPPAAAEPERDEALCVEACVCAVLALILLRRLPRVIESNEQGDVFLFDEPFWDCPPYDS